MSNKAILLKWTGDKELAATLNRMVSGSNTIARKSVTAGIRVISKAQKAAAPSSRFRRALGMSVKKGRAKAGIGVGIKGGNRVTSGRQVNPRMPQAHLLILGTATRRTKKGVSRGQIKPSSNQWVKNASDGAVPDAVEAMSTTAWAAIQKVVNEK